MSVIGNDPKSIDSHLLEARPIFSPPSFMRQAYLEKRRNELDALVSSAKGNEWKYVVTIAHHVRGTGGMFGFGYVGETAENLCRAIQNADPKCLEYVDRYVQAVKEAYV